MNKKDKHTNEAEGWKSIERINSRLEVGWDESKDEIWQRMIPNLEHAVASPKIIFWTRPAFRLLVAAMIVFMISIGSVMRFYSSHYQAVPGEHLMVELPDGSTVQLNAESAVSFHPFWWQFSRELSFSGEGYFEVEKGRQFTVNSKGGITQVLGTTFNIYSRDATYRVACLTGKVKVTDARKEHEIILGPNEKAEWEEGKFLKNEIAAADETAWLKNQFVFTATPINEVFDEIERQYGVRILRDLPLNFDYTGNFAKKQSVEEVLNYVCKPFSLKFVEQNHGEFKILRSE